MVRPSACSLRRLLVAISMELTLAWASESITSTFLPWNADSVSARARTIVDLPTPPFVFITAIVLRIAPANPRLTYAPPTPPPLFAAQLWQARDRPLPALERGSALLHERAPALRVVLRLEAGLNHPLEPAMVPLGGRAADLARHGLDGGDGERR